MEILKQKISDHKSLVVGGEPVQRSVIVKGVNLDFEYEQIPISAYVQYRCHAGKEIPGMPDHKLEWNITNAEMTTARNLKGEPVLDEQGEAVRYPSFTYFANIIKDPKAPNLMALLSMHIAENDAIGFFD